jgi:hypothetical protein
MAPEGILFISVTPRNALQAIRLPSVWEQRVANVAAVLGWRSWLPDACLRLPSSAASFHRVGVTRLYGPGVIVLERL